MANVRTGNTHYVDATGVLEAEGCRVAQFLVTATAASAVVVITDNAASPKNKLNLKLATDGETKQFDFSDSPLSFPAGLRVGTLTNAILMVVYSS